MVPVQLPALGPRQLLPSSLPAPCRLPAAVGACLFAGLVGVPLIKRAVTRDWEELNKTEVIPEFHGEGKVSHACMHIAHGSCATLLKRQQGSQLV